MKLELFELIIVPFLEPIDLYLPLRRRYLGQQFPHKRFPTHADMAMNLQGGQHNVFGSKCAGRSTHMLIDTVEQCAIKIKGSSLMSSSSRAARIPTEPEVGPVSSVGSSHNRPLLQRRIAKRLHFWPCPAIGPSGRPDFRTNGKQKQGALYPRNILVSSA